MRRPRRLSPVAAMPEKMPKKQKRNYKLKPLIVRSPGERVPRVFLDRWVDRIVRHLAKTQLPRAVHQRLHDADELTLVFVTDREMRRLNREFRAKDKVTDVLSFAPTDEHSLGELVFSLAVIRRQATDHGLTVHHELGYMVLHGVLHLLGYDHERTNRDAKQMFELQDKVFDAVLSRW